MAQLLDLPFATGVRQLTLEEPRGPVTVRCEHDDEWVTKRLGLPAVLSVAERLCEPCKRPPDERAAVAPERIRVLGSADLPGGPWGAEASPTWVGSVRRVDVSRARLRLEGPVVDQVSRAVDLLEQRDALRRDASADLGPPVPAPVVLPERVIGVVVEPGRPRQARALLGCAARLAFQVEASVVALVQARDAELPVDGADPVRAPLVVEGMPTATLASWGADGAVVLAGSDVEEDLAASLLGWLAATTDEPGGSCWALVVSGTAWGREIAARVAAATGSGLIGDAVDLEVQRGRLVAHKPAFSGATMAEIGCRSPLQLVTVRPGVLPVGAPRQIGKPGAGTELAVEMRLVAPRGRVEVLERDREDDSETMALAPVVLGLGQGVEPTRYHELEGLRRLLGAELAATRKVTDQGWLPRARQLGITGHAIAPRLFVSLGSSGRFNHMVGVRRAGTVLAVNPDPDAPVWEHADVGITARWEEAVPYLQEHLEERLAGYHDAGNLPNAQERAPGPGEAATEDETLR